MYNQTFCGCEFSERHWCKKASQRFLQGLFAERTRVKWLCALFLCIIVYYYTFHCKWLTWCNLCNFPLCGVPVYDSASISTLFILVQLFEGKNAPGIERLYKGVYVGWKREPVGAPFNVCFLMLFSKYRPTRWYTLVPLFIPSRRRTLYICISWIWILLDNGTQPRMQLSGMSLEEESSIFIASCPIETSICLQQAWCNRNSFFRKDV